MGELNKVTLGYFQAKEGNVGDDLNLWLWPKLFPNLDFSSPANTVLIGIGSIFDKRFITDNALDHFQKKIVLGAGARAGSMVPLLDDSWEVIFVRGPKTVSAFKNQQNINYITDPALLIGNFFTKSKAPAKVGLIPYFRSNELIWGDIAKKSGFTLISPKKNLELFIKEVSECKFVITEAMHGAIIADALRVPWIPYTSYSKIHEGDTHVFKWCDWLESMELNFFEINMPVVWDEEPSKLKLWLKTKLIADKLKKIKISNCLLSEEIIFKSKIDLLNDTLKEVVFYK